MTASTVRRCWAKELSSVHFPSSFISSLHSLPALSCSHSSNCHFSSRLFSPPGTRALPFAIHSLTLVLAARPSARAADTVSSSTWAEALLLDLCATYHTRRTVFVDSVCIARVATAKSSSGATVSVICGRWRQTRDFSDPVATLFNFLAFPPPNFSPLLFL